MIEILEEAITVIVSVLLAIYFVLCGSKTIGGGNDISKNSENNSENISNVTEIIEIKDIPTLENYNPDLVVQQYEGFNVIRDDLLLGGSKQRGILFLQQLPENINEVVYASPTIGYAQIALSLAAKLTGKKATVFLNKVRPQTEQTMKAIALGANVIEFPHANMRDLWQKAEDYVKNNSSCIEMPFGANDEVFKGFLRENIRKAARKLNPETLTGNMFVAGGSGVLASILHDVFPKMTIHVVQVGKKLDLDDSFIVHIAPEKFYQDAVQLPPYPSLKSYDAKVWQYVKQYGQPGDYIWNVA